MVARRTGSGIGIVLVAVLTVGLLFGSTASASPPAERTGLSRAIEVLVALIERLHLQPSDAWTKEGMQADPHGLSAACTPTLPCTPPTEVVTPSSDR